MNLRPSSLLLSGSTFPALLLLVMGVARCTTSTQDNFPNPPPGPPAACITTASLDRCVAGSTSYACTSDRPDDGDKSLVCDQGTPGVGGSTLYCCAPYGQWATACVPDAHVPGCGAQSIGFACTGETTPDEADTSLVCSKAIAGDAGGSQFCCISADPGSGLCRCASFDDASGLCGAGTESCGGASIGFTCAAGHAPSDLNPALVCTVPDGGATFCCQTP